MGSLTIGTMGYSLQFTAAIPPKAQVVLAKKLADEGDKKSKPVTFSLTPAWGAVPTISVKTLRESEEIDDIPVHWQDFDEVAPMIDGVAFYIVPVIPGPMAASFSMFWVNLRTGKQEQIGLTDNPQSFWYGRTHTPWIDGYRSGHMQGVRQFVPLRGEEAMKADVSDWAGVGSDHPFKDALLASFYTPTDLSLLERPQSSGYRTHGWDSALEASFGMSESKLPTLGVRQMTSRVGMGAGAVMAQSHPEAAGVSASDFFPTPVVSLATRMVWVDQYNKWVRKVEENGWVRKPYINDLRRKQLQYETQLWAQLGTSVQTDVDVMPEV